MDAVAQTQEELVENLHKHILMVIHFNPEHATWIYQNMDEQTAVAIVGCFARDESPWEIRYFSACHLAEMTRGEVGVQRAMEAGVFPHLVRWMDTENADLLEKILSTIRRIVLNHEHRLNHLRSSAKKMADLIAHLDGTMLSDALFCLALSFTVMSKEHPTLINDSVLTSLCRCLKHQASENRLSTLSMLRCLVERDEGRTHVQRIQDAGLFPLIIQSLEKKFTDDIWNEIEHEENRVAGCVVCHIAFHATPNQLKCLVALKPIRHLFAIMVLMLNEMTMMIEILMIDILMMNEFLMCLEAMCRKADNRTLESIRFQVCDCEGLQILQLLRNVQNDRTQNYVDKILQKIPADRVYQDPQI